MNTLMLSVVELMLSQTACPMTVNDFMLDSSVRKLFPYVTTSDRPDNSSGATAIRRNIQYLHGYLLAEDLAIDDTEIDQTYQLFTDIWQRRVSENRRSGLGNDDEICYLNDRNYGSDLDDDPNQTIHSWMFVLRYLFSDYRFLYE